MKLKRWFRRTVYAVAAFLLVVVILLLALPSILAGAWGRERLEGILSTSLDTPVHIGSVDFGWFRGVVVDDIVLGADRETGLRVRRLTARPDLLSLLGDEVRLRRIEVEGVELAVVRGLDGAIRIEGWPEPRAQEEPGEKTPPSEMPKLSGVIAVRDAAITFRDEATGAADAIRDIGIDVTFEPGATTVPVAVSSATAGIDFQGSVDLFEDGRIRDAPAARGRIGFSGFRFEHHAALLPFVEGIDELRGGLGGSIAVEAPTPTEITATLDLTGDGLAVAGPALDRPVRSEGGFTLGGRITLSAGDIDIEKVLLYASGLSATARSGRFSRDGVLEVDLTASGTASDLPAGLRELVPAGFGGSLGLGVKARGTLERLEADYEFVASAIEAPGLPAPLGATPVEARGRATWSGPEGGLVATSTIVRGMLQATVDIRMEGDRDAVLGVVIDGDLQEDELGAFLPAATLARLGSGPATVRGHLRATSTDGVVRLEIGDEKHGPLTLTRGGPDRRLALSGTVLGRDGWSADLTAGLTTEHGPVLDGFPEFGSDWGVTGRLVVDEGFSTLDAEGVAVRLGDSRLEVESAHIDALLSDARSGHVKARWSSPLGTTRNDLTPPLTLDGRGEGRVDVTLGGGTVRIASDTETTDLLVRVPGRADIREPRARIRTGLELGPDGRIDLTSLAIETEHASAAIEGALTDILGTPSGTVRVTARGDLARFRPFLAHLEPDVPTGTFTTSLDATLDADSMRVVGRVQAKGLAVGTRLRADEADVEVNAILARDGSHVILSRLVARADETGAEVVGRLDLGDGPPAFSGRITAAGDLARFGPFLAALGPDAPTGTFTTSLGVTLDAETLQLQGQATARALRVGTRFQANEADIDLDATLARDGSHVILRRMAARADENRAEASGRLDLGAGSPRFVGQIEASGDLGRIPPDLLPQDIRATGATKLVASINGDGRGTFEVEATNLRVEGVAGPEPVEEKSVRLTGAFTWTGTEAALSTSRIEAPWGTLSLDGDVRMAGLSDATLDMDVDLPAFLRAHESLVPEKSKGLGRLAGRFRYSGDLRTPKLATGEGRVTVERLTIPGYDLKDAVLDLDLAGGVLAIREAGGQLNGGPTTFTGEVDLREDRPVLTGKYSTRDLRLGRLMEPAARLASPMFSMASELSGKVTIEGDLETGGLTPADWLRGLSASADFRLAEARVSGSPMMKSLLDLLERTDIDSFYDFSDIRADIRISDGKLVTDDFRFVSEKFEIRFRGFTALTDQSMKYAVRVKLPGQEKNLPKWLRALDADGFIPLRLGGKLTAPSLLPPDPTDIGKSLLDDLLRGALDKEEKRRKEREKKDKKKKSEDPPK